MPNYHLIKMLRIKKVEFKYFVAGNWEFKATRTTDVNLIIFRFVIWTQAEIYIYKYITARTYIYI